MVLCKVKGVTLFGGMTILAILQVFTPFGKDSCAPSSSLSAAC